ncbi:MAG TPA: DUF3089 domain-containing protein [Bacteroidales bacterium]|nr:DUF3089 domain-containing protein [Bacteroidales bacterium]
MRVFGLITTIILIIISCSTDRNKRTFLPPEPDYSDSVNWYGLSDISAERVADIFYVYPTVGTKSVDKEGNRLFFTDIGNFAEREAALENQRYNHQVYAAGDYNFYAPYYRQLTMEAYSLPLEEIVKYSKIPASDIADAFEFYMKNFNNGKPFILLGHSQGSQMLLELLKSGMKNDYLSHMVAAYLIGWTITPDELTVYPDRLKPARGESDTGVLIVFNSLTDYNSRSPSISASAVGINPINWTTDTTFAPKSAHLGFLKYNHTSGHYDTIVNFTGGHLYNNFMICKDIDPMIVYNKEFHDLFPPGNLHFMDSWLYGLNLKANMAVRVRAFLGR